MAATLPPIDSGPAPLSAWQTVLILDAHGQQMHSIALYVPTSGRCDQHAAEVDGARADRTLTATDIGRMVSRWIASRPSVALMADARRSS